MVTVTLPAQVTNAQHLDAAANDDAFAVELVEHDGRRFRIVLGERRAGFQHRHLAAETAEGLAPFPNPMGPAPMMMRWRGRSVSVKIVSLVR